MLQTAAPMLQMTSWIYTFFPAAYNILKGKKKKDLKEESCQRKPELVSSSRGKKHFIQDYCNKGKRTQYKPNINSKYNKGRMEFITNELTARGGVAWVENY